VLSICSYSCERGSWQRAPIPGFAFEWVPFRQKVNEAEEEFYMTLHYGSLEEIERLLQAGHSPDYTEYPGSIPWHETNPLWDIAYDYDRVELLIKYNADTKKRPYVAAAVERRLLSRKEEEVYRVVKLLLDSGASPTMKWAQTKLLRPPTDKTYLTYFEKKGKTPINIAIAYNSVLIVDLLLSYGALLDDDSLREAKKVDEKSNSTNMYDYIQKKLEEQAQES
jgi:hypothetical protein